MNKTALALLEALLNAPSPSGSEGPVRRIFCDALQGIADEVRVDVHGNAIATINPEGSPHVMLAGHMDEIGFQICHVDEHGLMRFRAIGGHDLRTISGRRVHIHTADGPMLGVIGQRPVHLLKDRKGDSAPKISDFWIDAGFTGKKAALKVVQIGDPVTYVEGFTILRDRVALARAFDNRVGAFVVAQTLRELKGTKGLKARVTAVGTVQEEIGLRGAVTSTFGLAPDAGIAVDVTFATDNPGGDAKEIGEVKLGGGPVITRGPNVNPPLFELLRSTAIKQRLPVQYRSAPGGTGTDANAMQISRAGVATALIGIPNRYMHSPVELCHLDDIQGAVNLLAATLRRLDGKTSFIPS